MPTYLHQILAVLRTADAEAKHELEAVQKILAVGGDKNPLTGLMRTHKPRTDADVEQPTEARRVQAVTADFIKHVAATTGRLMDIQLVREIGNTQAKADVVVDGRPLLADVPAGYLLFLETQLQALITGLIERLQVLDPAEEWIGKDADPALPKGVWKSVARKTLSTTKRPEKQELAPPDSHGNPAQVRWYDADAVTGEWTWTKYSGQLPVAEVQEIRARATRLLEAVKYAREQANRVEVTNRAAGHPLLGYIFGDLVSSDTERQPHRPHEAESSSS